MNLNTNKLTEKLVSQKIQNINAIVLLSCTLISAIVSLIPPIDNWFTENNIYIMVCYTLATSIGLMVFSIFERVNKIEPSGNHYKPLKEVGKLLNRLDDNICVDIYFGLDDQLLFNQLIDFLNLHTNISDKYHIYIKSHVISKINNENLFKSYNFNLSYDLPEIILIHAKHANPEDELQSYFIRYSQNNEFEYLSLDSKNEILLTLTKNFFNNVKSIYLSDSFISKAMKYIFETNSLELENLINNKCLEIRSRETFFKYMIELLKGFNSNIYAIDFILPKYWLNYNYNREYGLAHKGVTAKIKQRIHIVDLNRIKAMDPNKKIKEIESYVNYTNFMRNECGVQLFFLELDKFDSMKYEKRGSLVLENECVFVAINPSDGAPLGEIDFNDDKIKLYKERFNDCLKSAQEAEKFINEIFSKI